MLNVSDKSEIEFHKDGFLFNSVPDTEYGLNTLSIEIPTEYFDTFGKEQSDVSFLCKKIYYLCFIAQLHKHFAIVLGLILLSILVLKYPKSYLARASLFFSFCIISYIKVLWPYTQQLFLVMRHGSEYDALTKIILSQFPSILIIFVPLFIYQVLGYAKYVLMLAGLILFFVFVSDLFSIAQFSTHPVLSDLFTYSSDILKSRLLIQGFISSNVQVTLLIVLSFVIYISLWSFNNKTANKTLLQIRQSIFMLFMFAISVIPQKQILKEYLLDSIYLIAVHTSKYGVAYSDSYIYRNDEKIYSTIDGLNRRKNVIVIMVESLSANESQFWNGNFNYTKELDKLAKENFSFKNYYANNFNTDINNFSLLTSIPYLNNQKRTSEDIYYANTVPNAFKKEGYSTHVLSSAENIGPLESVWEKAGFENFYDGSDPFYDKSERLTFNSVPDLDMYNKLLSKTKEWEKKGPYFAFLMTSTSHGPYIVPKTHELDYHKCIEYVDSALLYLYQELEKQGFFKNGMLVITADHRYMEVYSNEEIRKHDKRGITRVPLLIIDSDYKNLSLNQPFSHSQLGQYLEYLNLKKVNLYRFNFIPSVDRDSNKSVKPIYYQYHTPSDSVLVITENSKNGEHEVKLNGDKTKFVVDIKDEALKKKIFEDIYIIRR